MPDARHVSSAITYFHKCPPAKRKQLATAINKKAKQFGMKVKVSADNPFHKYADESILED
jgi:hypothetical protein